ncbi:hypothetical protein [Clostridioides difficile]|nr:hypothetical protein [Clostridioides difficile]
MSTEVCEGAKVDAVMFLLNRRSPRIRQGRSSAASDVYKRHGLSLN